MIRSFLALVALAVLPALAVAQLPASPYSFAGGTCTGGVCPRVQAAVQTVRAAGADAFHLAGDLVGGPPLYRQPVPPVTPAASAIPQRMPGPAVSYPVTPQPRQPVRDALRRLIGR